jgi:hypothetical protein
MTRSGYLPVLVLTSLAALTAACEAGSEPSPARSGPAVAATASASAPAGASGDAATWRLKPGQDLQPTSTGFTALVARLACNGGVTGEVLAPTIHKSERRIVVTFTVAARQPGAATCRGNNEVPFEVDLGEPLRDRSIADGECLPDKKGPKPYCSPDPIRYRA